MLYIKGINFPNKGAELMLHCIVRRLRNNFQNCPEIMADVSYGSDYGYRTLAADSILQRVDLSRKGMNFGRLADFVPPRILRSYGLAAPKETKLVLDASGLAYTDKFGHGSLMRIGPVYKKVKSSGGKVVMLPQAFGPLTVIKYQNAFRDLLYSVDLICARDRISYEEVLRFTSAEDKVLLVPDLTIGETFDNYPARECAAGKLGIVMNFRLIESLAKALVAPLIERVASLCEFAEDIGIGAVFILHEGERDYQLCVDVQDKLKFAVPIVRDDDPRVLKSTLGVCRAVFALRYHACVGALSQGVPCYSLGWNHKYKTLFEDFDHADGVLDHAQLSDDAAFDTVIEKVKSDISDPNRYRSVQSRLLERKQTLSSQLDSMWSQVNEMITQSF